MGSTVRDWLLVLGLVAGAGVLPALAQQAGGGEPADERATTGPSLHVPRTEVDLGRVPEGEDAAAEFVIENRGTAELRILKAKAG
jgi:hypothetical protein